MKKVIEYLDENFTIINDGHWIYEGENNSSISININNETLQLKCQINGEIVRTLYSHLQTYKHLPRGESDENGYYIRSTDEEVIRYIKIYESKLAESKVSNYLEEWFNLIEKSKGDKKDYYYDIPGLGSFKNLEIKMDDTFSNDEINEINITFKYDDYEKN